MASFFVPLLTEWPIKVLTFPRRGGLSFVPRAGESEPGLAGVGNLNRKCRIQVF